MPNYDVAGLGIEVDNALTFPLQDMAAYSVAKKGKEDLKFHFATQKQIDWPEGEAYSDEGAGYKWIKRPMDNGFCLFTCKYGALGEILVKIDIDPTWQNALITWAEFKEENEREQSYVENRLLSVTHTMMGIVFRHSLLYHQGLVIHSSTIKWLDKGIMFTAPSGTGKSTQVSLWQKYINDVIVLNDDNPAVRIIDDKPVVYGTPWSGTSKINTNDFAPLAAIVILEQAKENTIIRLTVPEAIIKLMPRIFMPYFDQVHMNKAMDIFEQIVSSVPIYFLKCRPDQEAVELVYQCMK